MLVIKYSTFALDNRERLIQKNGTKERKKDESIYFVLMNCLEIASFERRGKKKQKKKKKKGKKKKKKKKRKRKKRNFEDRLISRELYNLEQTQKAKRRRIFRLATLSSLD